MGLTTDPTDPRLGRGVDAECVPQNEVYLVLSEEERAKGFVRPVRDTYWHMGPAKPKYPIRELSAEQKERTAGSDYVAYEEYPESESPRVGRYWTQEQLDAKGCGMTTKMGQALAETYARQPSFYSSTYCCTCEKHLPVEEFRWVPDGAVVGS